MARRRGAGLNLLIPLVVFVFIAVATTLLAVIFYNAKVKSDETTSTIQTTLDRFIKPGELDSFAKLHGDKPSGASYAGWLDDEVKDLKKVITGKDSTSIDDIKDSAKQTDNLPLLLYIDKLKTASDADQSMIARLQDELKKAQDSMAVVEADQRSVTDKYNSSIDQATASFKSEITGYQDQITKLNENLNALTQQRDQSLVDTQNDVKRLENVVAQKDQEILNLSRKVTELQPKRGSGLPTVDTALQPKGTVQEAPTSESKLVYIDRGRLQHVVPGMTFEVFDHSTGISEDEHGNPVGKATIEVVNVSDNDSACRVIRLAPRQNILQGDVLANAVYDPNYKFKFMVFGDFDIDKTGLATQADKQRIKSVISEWGGTLVDNLSYDTDFLVLGEEPKFPQPLPPGTIDPDVIRQHTAEEEKYKEYQQLIDSAKRYLVPILNQNRFLALVGYYKR